MSDVIEVCSVKITAGSEAIYEIRIYRPFDKAKLPQFDLILGDVLSRFIVADCVSLVGDLN